MYSGYVLKRNSSTKAPPMKRVFCSLWGTLLLDFDTDEDAKSSLTPKCVLELIGVSKWDGQIGATKYEHGLLVVSHIGTTYYLSVSSQEEKNEWITYIRSALECNFANTSIIEFRPSKASFEATSPMDNLTCPISGTKVTTPNGLVACTSCGQGVILEHTNEITPILQIGQENCSLKVCTLCSDAQACLLWLKKLLNIHTLLLHERTPDVLVNVNRYKASFKLRRLSSSRLDMAAALREQESVTDTEFEELRRVDYDYRQEHMLFEFNRMKDALEVLGDDMQSMLGFLSNPSGLSGTQNNTLDGINGSLKLYFLVVLRLVTLADVDPDLIDFYWPQIIHIHLLLSKSHQTPWSLCMVDLLQQGLLAIALKYPQLAVKLSWALLAAIGDYKNEKKITQTQYASCVCLLLQLEVHTYGVASCLTGIGNSSSSSSSPSSSPSSSSSPSTQLHSKSILMNLLGPANHQKQELVIELYTLIRIRRKAHSVHHSELEEAQNIRDNHSSGQDEDEDDDGGGVCVVEENGSQSQTQTQSHSRYTHSHSDHGGGLFRDHAAPHRSDGRLYCVDLFLDHFNDRHHQHQHKQEQEGQQEEEKEEEERRGADKNDNNNYNSNHASGTGSDTAASGTGDDDVVGMHEEEGGGGGADTNTRQGGGGAGGGSTHTPQDHHLDTSATGSYSPKVIWQGLSDQLDWVEKLTDLVDTLRFVDRAARAEVLKVELNQLFCHPKSGELLSSLALDPTSVAGEPMYRLKRLFVEETRVFRTKARAPSLLIFEVEKTHGTSTIPIPSGATTDATGTAGTSGGEDGGGGGGGGGGASLHSPSDDDYEYMNKSHRGGSFDTHHNHNHHPSRSRTHTQEESGIAEEEREREGGRKEEEEEEIDVNKILDLKMQATISSIHRVEEERKSEATDTGTGAGVTSLSRRSISDTDFTSTSSSSSSSSSSGSNGSGSGTGGVAVPSQPSRSQSSVDLSAGSWATGAAGGSSGASAGGRSRRLSSTGNFNAITKVDFQERVSVSDCVPEVISPPSLAVSSPPLSSSSSSSSSSSLSKNKNKDKDKTGENIDDVVDDDGNGDGIGIDMEVDIGGGYIHVPRISNDVPPEEVEVSQRVIHSAVQLFNSGVITRDEYHQLVDSNQKYRNEAKCGEEAVFQAKLEGYFGLDWELKKQKLLGLNVSSTGVEDEKEEKEEEEKKKMEGGGEDDVTSNKDDDLDVGRDNDDTKQKQKQEQKHEEEHKEDSGNGNGKGNNKSGESNATADTQQQQQHQHRREWPERDLRCFIVKSNDDLRQEVACIQLIELCQEIFADCNLNESLWLKPYRIVSTGPAAGFVETLPNTLSIDAIKKTDNFISLPHFFQSLYGSSSNRHEKAKKNFVKSLAAYSLVSYILCIKDRHNGNILIDQHGHVIHIDFGFLLGIAPGGSFSIESAPFKLTEEMLDVFGGIDSDLFSEFVKAFTQGFLALRSKSTAILSAVSLIANDSSFPCFQGKDTSLIMDKLRQRFKCEMSSSDAIEHCLELIIQSYSNLGTRQYDSFQWYTNGIIP